MSKPYAQGTSVPVDRSEAEIKSLLRKHGATQFMFGSADAQALVAFEIKVPDDGKFVTRRLRFIVPMPVQTRSMTENKVKAETRRRWRALLLVLKAKLEAVHSGIVTFDAEFLAHIVVDGSTTVGDRLVPELSRSLESGNLPPLLGAGS